MNTLEILAAQDLLSEINGAIYESENVDSAIDILTDGYYIKEENNNEL